MSKLRLDKYLADMGVGTRQEVKALIRKGRVAVDGITAKAPELKVDPDEAQVTVDGNSISYVKMEYWMLHKPAGVVSATEDRRDRTVLDLLSDAARKDLFPVGRLDKNSVGVLLITNDGELTRKLTHPSYNKQKVYQVTLDKPLAQADMTKIAEGITLEDGEIHADEISYVSENRKEVGIEIHSGRNRIVRRIFESLGYSVQKLDRVYFAGLTKKKLKRGGWRFLSPMEVNRLKSGEYE